MKTDVIQTIASQYPVSPIEVDFLASYLLLKYQTTVGVHDFISALDKIMQHCTTNGLSVMDIVKLDIQVGTKIDSICGEL